MISKHLQQVPDDIATAIEKSAKASRGFSQMPPSHQEEFLRYILEAKKPEIRKHRIALSVAAIERWYANRAKKPVSPKRKR